MSLLPVAPSRSALACRRSVGVARHSIPAPTSPRSIPLTLPGPISPRASTTSDNRAAGVQGGARRPAPSDPTAPTGHARRSTRPARRRTRAPRTTVVASARRLREPVAVRARARSQVANRDYDRVGASELRSRDPFAGGSEPFEGSDYSGGFAFFTRSSRYGSNSSPASGAPGEASSETQFASKRAALASAVPSDSPGTLIQR